MTVWESIFPTPVMRTNLGRPFSDAERTFFRKMHAQTRANVFNKRSVNTKVLDAPEMQSIRSSIADSINQFGWKFISAYPMHSYFITQSWLNFTERQQSHHRHYHPNSLISGVLYIQVSKDIDAIRFYRDSFSQIMVTDEHTNEYNEPARTFAVDAGDLVLFPSTLVHEVEQTRNKDTRISLAFNAFVKGELGSEDRLNALSIG